MGINKPRREASEGSNPANTLVSNVQPSELGGSKCLLHKPPGLWYFLGAAPADYSQPWLHKRAPACCEIIKHAQSTGRRLPSVHPLESGQTGWVTHFSRRRSWQKKAFTNTLYKGGRRLFFGKRNTVLAQLSYKCRHVDVNSHVRECMHTHPYTPTHSTPCVPFLTPSLPHPIPKPATDRASGNLCSVPAPLSFT